MPQTELIRTTNGNNICGVIDIVLVLSAVDSEFEHRSGQTNDDKIEIYCFVGNHGVFGSKYKDWLAQNHDNVSKRRDTYFCWSELACWSSTKGTPSSSHRM